MEKRRLGRTEHMSSIVSFGGAAFMKIDQDEADRVLKLVFEHGINHLDVAPHYEDAEIRIGPWMKKYRKQCFLACKTLERTRKAAVEDLHRSLKRLQTDHFDLYQLHFMDKMSDLEIALGPDGAIEAIVEAHSQGLLNYIGITGHNLPLQLEALNRFDFDSVMFPFNFILYRDSQYRSNFEKLMAKVRERDVAALAIKAIAQGNWEKEYQVLDRYERPYSTWYKPFEEVGEIAVALSFALSMGFSTMISASDVKLLELTLDAIDKVHVLKNEENDALLREAEKYSLLEFTF
jgi:aryl-alcohol dehydrogenase-like predicted oxidoreductase